MSVHGYSHCLWENGRGVLTRCVKLKSQWLEEVPLAGGSANTYAVRSVSRPPHGPAERDRSELLAGTTAAMTPGLRGPRQAPLSERAGKQHS
jgi:hypothetical protein